MSCEEAVFHAANAALKDILGSLSLSKLLGEREKVVGRLEEILDESAVGFGGGRVGGRRGRKVSRI